jgi:ACS family hexuronate transporter-like MFS transporter
LLATPATLRAVTLVCAAAPAYMFVLLWLPQYLETVRDVPKRELAGMLWVAPVCFDLGAVGFGLLAGRLESRAGGRRSHTDLVGVAALLTAMLALVPLASSAGGAMAFASAASAGVGALYALLTADMMGRVHPAHVSMAGGLTAAAQSLMYVLLNPLVGRWADRTHSFDLPMIALGVLALPGALVWMVSAPSGQGASAPRGVD